MPLQDTIADIQAKLKSNGYPNEQAISQGIVLRLLQELGWDTYDTQVVIPEYTTGKGRVDFALCVQKNKPFIFIEVKQPGNLSGADEQVFNYAYHQGTPFIIVTDGKEWHFYLPTAPGNYEERKVYNLDMLEREPRESEHRLQRYLAYKEVANGGALISARADHEDETKKRKAANSIPDAWGKLLDEKDEMILDLLSEKVESLCGHRPRSETVFSYLRGLGGVQAQSQPQSYSPPAKANHSKTYQPITEHKKPPKPLSIMRVIFPDGTEICESRAVDTLVEALHKIGYERVQSVDIKCQGFPFVLKQNPNPGDSRWRDSGYGYFVCVNTSTDAKIKILNKVAQQLGIALKIEKTPRQ